MCLYPRIIKNKKYTANKKNKGRIPEIKDERVLYVPVGCGKCMECKKQKARQWQVRLHEEIRENKNGKFVTLTFNEKELEKLQNEINGIEGYNLENETATIAVRRFLERWRKKYKKSVKHWLVTELGQTNTERIHLHGILFTNETEETIKKIWKYGNIWIGEYVNGRTINYIVKYVNKTDEIHKEYQNKILTSPGIGKRYIKREDSKRNRYNKKGTKETYTTREGTKLALPIYYRNHIYTDEEKEKLWLEKLDKKERWVNGKKVSIKENEKGYYKLLNEARKKNKKLGYGDNTIDWERKRYENQRRNLIKINKIKKMGQKKDETNQPIFIYRKK